MDRWTYLAEQPHRWRRQLYIKGRRLLASTVWRDMLSNDMSRAEAAKNWELPLEAIDEILSYCEANEYLLELETQEEAHRLASAGLQLDPAP